MILEAIAQEEGFFEPHSRPRRNNNPGDLVYCPESVRFGATGSDGHFAIFPDSAIGFTALRRWLLIPAKFDKHGNLEAGYLGATIKQVVNRFAPASDNNDTNAYLSNICKRANVTPDTILTDDLLR